MKRTLRVVAALALLGMSFGGSPKAEAAAALAVAGTINMAYGTFEPVGCPTGINFVPPSVVDPCTPTQDTYWQFTVTGAVTGRPGAIGVGVCLFTGEAEEQLAYGSGEVSGDCYIGPDGLTDCTIRYSRLGVHIVGIVSGCMTGTIVLQAVPADTALRSMAVTGTLSGA